MSVKFTDNSRAVLSELEAAKARALETIGLKWEGYSKRLCPVGTTESTGVQGYHGGTLRNSITHRVDGDALSVGSNFEYAPQICANRAGKRAEGAKILCFNPPLPA